MAATTVSDNRKKLTDKWLGEVLMPSRHMRDYYASNEFGRLTIRMSEGEIPQAIFNRVPLCEVTTRGDVRLLCAGLQIRLKE